MEDRLQKILSAAGVCSRRRAETYIQQGRVTVNGRPGVLGERADPDRDQIALDGVPVGRRGDHQVLMLYKPRGVVTTLSDEKGRPTVADLVRDCGERLGLVGGYPVGARTAAELVSGCGARVYPVGRLDMDSEGLLLLTGDGALTHGLLHPRHQVEKEYLVWVEGFYPGAVEALTRPMTLNGQRLRPARVRMVRPGPGSALLSVVIHEGKNRQIRRMCAHCGLTVKRLKRIREGRLLLDRDLRPGQWRPLTQAEVKVLREESFLQE